MTLINSKRVNAPPWSPVNCLGPTARWPFDQGAVRFRPVQAKGEPLTDNKLGPLRGRARGRDWPTESTETVCNSLACQPRPAMSTGIGTGDATPAAASIAASPRPLWSLSRVSLGGPLSRARGFLALNPLRNLRQSERVSHKAPLQMRFGLFPCCSLVEARFRAIPLASA
jgi:hypothetical protein